MSTKHVVLGLVVALFIFSMSSLSLATPSLGVATNEAYIGIGDAGLEPYQDYFVDKYIAGTVETHGFVIGPSPETLIVWASAEFKDVHIWLLTDADIFSDNAPIINGTTLTSANKIDSNGKNIDGYKPKPYYGIDLGAMTETSPWYLLKDFPGEGQTFYAMNVTLAYTGTIPSEHYFFAYANVDGDGYLDPTSNLDKFSPKTDSATDGYKVPEPGTLVLLGMGLFGIALAGRKK